MTIPIHDAQQVPVPQAERPEQPDFYAVVGFVPGIGWMKTGGTPRSADVAINAFKEVNPDAIMDTMRLYRLSPQPQEDWRRKAAEWLRKKAENLLGVRGSMRAIMISACDVLASELDAEAGGGGG